MKIALSLLLGATSLALAACDVDQTKEGDLPEVDVNVTGGEMPEYNVDAPEVTVGTENKVVEVPDVDVEPADAGGNSN